MTMLMKLPLRPLDILVLQRVRRLNLGIILNIFFPLEDVIVWSFNIEVGQRCITSSSCLEPSLPLFFRLNAYCDLPTLIEGCIRGSTLSFQQIHLKFTITHTIHGCVPPQTYIHLPLLLSSIIVFLSYSS